MTAETASEEITLPTNEYNSLGTKMASEGITELLPCPFCGNAPLVDSCNEGGSSIRCRTFMCPLDDIEVSDDTAEDVTKRWNRRDGRPAQCALSREQIAQVIYEAEPYYEGGEYVDGFQVSPGGNLSWQQAVTRDAEFGDDPLMGKITEFAYRCADAVIALSAVTSTDGGKVDGAYFTECNYPKCGCARFGRCENAVKDETAVTPADGGGK